MNREHQEHIVDLLTTKLGKAEQWPLAGRLLKTFGFDVVCRVLENMQDGVGIAYLYGALKNEKRKTLDFTQRQDLEELTEAWTNG